MAETDRLARQQPGGPCARPGSTRRKRSIPVNVPNVLTTLRLCAVPALLWLAWEGQSTAFFAVLIGCLVTDLVDGPTARWLNQTSEFGSRYDSLADAAIYATLPICVWWLKPDFIGEEAVFIVTAIVCYVVPLGFSLFRFGRVPSLHTAASKCAAVFLGVAIPLALLDWWRLPFRIGAVAYVAVAIEEMAILMVLPEWRTNVSTLHQAVAIRKQARMERSPPTEQEP
jgi:phosphatidylglycerophosphate synthase